MSDRPNPGLVPEARRVLDEYLRTISFRSEVYFRGQVCDDWYLDTSGPGHVNVHVVCQGNCWFRLPGWNEPLELHEGDVVAYMTKDFAYPATTPSARRLVAVLRIHKTWPTHQEAAGWYRQQDLPLPGNCMVKGTDPLPLELTDRYNPNPRDWEAHYWQVARAHGVFHACEPIFRDVVDPPRLQTRQMQEWYGEIPNPREASPLAPSAFGKMLDWLATQVADSARHPLQALKKSLLHQALRAKLR